MSSGATRWSGWEWDDNRGQKYRSRLNAQGDAEYEFESGPIIIQRRTPRNAEPTVDSVTTDFAQLSHADYAQPGPSTAEYEEYSYANETQDPRSRHKSSRRHGDEPEYERRDHGKSSKGSSSHKDKDRKYDKRDKDKDRDRDRGKRSEPERHDRGKGKGVAYKDDDNTGQPSRSHYVEDAAIVGSYNSESGGHYPAHYGSSNEPSAGEYADVQQSDPAYDRSVGETYSYAYDPNQQTGGSSSMDAYAPMEDDRSATPKPMISSSNAWVHDDMDPRYRQYQSSRFEPGEIFKVYWAEPLGDHGVTMSSRRELSNPFGAKFYVGFRRFVVIANDEGHCTCVPILTYSGRACTKRGVKPRQHGIIHEKGHRARLLKDEPKLGYAPIRAELYAEGEKLSKESRINYSKLVSVEHNIRVFFIGSIAAEDWDIVSDAVNSSWADKVKTKRFKH